MRLVAALGSCSVTNMSSHRELLLNALKYTDTTPELVQDDGKFAKLVAWLENTKVDHVRVGVIANA